MYNGYQGHLNENDMSYISALSKKCPRLEQILVTGEIALNNIDNEMFIIFNGCNAMLKNTLFLLTNQNTMRMTRYDSESIWSRLPQKRLTELFMIECERLGVVHWSTQYPNFYDGVFSVNNMYGKYVILDDIQSTMYINSVLLLKKHCAYDVRLSQFFSLFSFDGVELMSLSKEQEDELHRVISVDDYYPSIDEMCFLIELAQKEKISQKIISFPGGLYE